MWIVKRTFCFHDRFEFGCFIKTGDTPEAMMMKHYAMNADKQAKLKAIFAVVKQLEKMLRRPFDKI